MGVKNSNAIIIFFQVVNSLYIFMYFSVCMHTDTFSHSNNAGT